MHIYWNNQNYIQPPQSTKLKKKKLALVPSPLITQYVLISFLFFLLKRGRIFILSFHNLTPTPILFFNTLFFLFNCEKISPPQINNVNTFTLCIWFPNQKKKKKKLEKKFSYTSLGRYLWLSLMLVGPEVDDHFTLNLFNKVIPHQILKYCDFFFQNFFFADIFSGCLHVFAIINK